MAEEQAVDRFGGERHAVRFNGSVRKVCLADHEGNHAAGRSQLQYGEDRRKADGYSAYFFRGRRTADIVCPYRLAGEARTT
ncbi:hypothetical protein D3C77_556860 [compost metagenome]